MSVMIDQIFINEDMLHIYIYIYIYIYPGQVISKTQKMVLDATLLNTQNYKVRIMGKVEQSRERSNLLPQTLLLELLKRDLSGHP